MKKLILLFLLFLLFAVQVQAATYTIGADASDDYTTHTLMNAGETVAAGDIISFRKGETFRETVTVEASGSSGSPITYTAHGTGADPIIDGSDIIADEDWSDEGGNIWSAAATTEIKQLFIDGVKVNKARWPAADWEEINTTSGDQLHLQSDALTQDDDYWIGCEVFVKLNNWRIERKTITDSAKVAETITWVGNIGAAPTDTYGFYIEGNPNDLDAHSEWCWLNDKVYVYDGNDDPTGYVITGSVRDYGITANTKSYIVVQDLNIKNTNADSLYFYYPSYITIDSCTISNSVGKGIHLLGTGARTYGNCTVTGNTISYTESEGILLSGLTNTVFSDNTLSYIGADSLSPRDADGIDVYISDNMTVTDNTLSYIAKCGMIIRGDSIVVVSDNEVSNFATAFSDCGGIYTTLCEDVAITIKNNYVHTAVAGFGGSPSTTSNIGGIYLDDSNDIDVEYNIVHDVNGFGLFLHHGEKNKFYNNTVYNCKYLLRFSEDASPVDGVIDNIIKNNIFTCGLTTQEIYYLTGPAGSTAAMGDFDNNIVYNSGDSSSIKYIRTSIDTTYTLAQWQSTHSQDISSLAADPMFVSADANDFHLKSNSPCLGIGRYPAEGPAGRSRYNYFDSFKRGRR